MAAINDYFIVISVLGMLFQAYLAALIWRKSETLNIHFQNRHDSMVSLLVSIFVIIIN